MANDGGLALAAKNENITYAELLARNGLATLAVEGHYDPLEEANGPQAVFSFSAVFAEVRVDPDLGLMHLNRLVGAHDVGRIVNPKTARSQAIGGIIWGVGQALLEQSETAGYGPLPPPLLFRPPRADECGYPGARHPVRR
jgi:xanthine dehydrogenase YagR molybdenum-binding subunit